MNSPENMGPAPWTRATEIVDETTLDAELRARHEQARDYVFYHLPDAPSGLVAAAMSLINAHREDLENEQYWKVGLSDRLQLKSADVKRLEGFVTQLKEDRGWGGDTPGGDTAAAAEEVPTVAVAAEASPEVFNSPAEARPSFMEQMDALTAELEALQPVPGDLAQTRDNFLAVLNKYAVTMRLENGRDVKGFPITIHDSAIPQEEWSEWGSHIEEKVSSGAFSAIKNATDEAMKGNATPLQGVYPRAITETFNRLFLSQ